MESVNLTLLKDVWQQLDITGGAVINHRSGGVVLYTAADSEPTTPAPTTAIIDSTSIGEVITFDAISSPIWAVALNDTAVISTTGISQTAPTTFEGLSQPLTPTMSMSVSEVYTAMGLRFSHKFDLTFTGNETKYFLYATPASGADFILGVQERLFKSLNEQAELTVYAAATGYTATTPDANVQKANPIQGIDTQMTIYNLTDGAGNAEPAANAGQVDTDFVTGGGSGNNTIGGFSPQIGSKLFPAGANIVLKVTNLDNSSNRISLEYSWIEFPLDYLT